MENDVKVVVNNKTIEMPMEAWKVLLDVLNFVVSSGDAYALMAERHSKTDIDAANAACNELIDATLY